jgi:hypothetical protein
LEVAIASLVIALALSPGVRNTLRRSNLLGFYFLAAIVTWLLALGPRMGFMGRGGHPGLFLWLMPLPGVNGLRVPARFWLMTVLCLSVVAGIVIAELVRGRSRVVMGLIVLLVGSAVLGDGWIDRIDATDLPRTYPGNERLVGATVLELPLGSVHDIPTVFRAVTGGFRIVNGYSGWQPNYYYALEGAARAEVPDVLTPFQRRDDLHLLVPTDAPRLRSLVDTQPGVSTIASDPAFVHYLLPRRRIEGPPRPSGERLRLRELHSPCSAALLSMAVDGDETTAWECGVWDDRQLLTIDLGDGGTVGAVVHSLGTHFWLFPLGLTVDTSEDGSTWMPAWSGNVLDAAINSGLEDPKRMRIVVAFPPRRARLVRLRAVPADVKAPWSIAELEVWSSSQTH